MDDMHKRAVKQARYFGWHCSLWVDGQQCEGDGAYRLYADGEVVPGILCREHAWATVDEYLDKLGWVWFVIPIHHDPPAEIERTLYLTPHQNAVMSERARIVADAMYSAGYGYRGGSELHRIYYGGRCDEIQVNIARMTVTCIRHGCEVETLKWSDDIPERIEALEWVAKATSGPQLKLFETQPRSTDGAATTDD